MYCRLGLGAIVFTIPLARQTPGHARSLARGDCVPAFDIQAHVATFQSPAGPSVIVDPPDGKLPYLPEAAKRAKLNWDERDRDPVGYCHSHGVPRSLVPPFPLEIVQDGDHFAILSETEHTVRIIPLDGRPHRKNYWAWMGDSRGRWEGDTLVVDVTGLNGKTWLDQAGNFVDENEHVVERFTMTGPNTIVYEATVTDPTVYSRPWTMRLACLFAAPVGCAYAQSGDLRGVWKAEGKAYLNLETPGVIFEPASGKIQYRPEAQAQAAANFQHRAAADPDGRCFQPGVPRAAALPYPFQILQNDRAVYIVYQRAHSYRILYLNGTPHNEGLAYAMGDSRAHWEGSTLVADVASFSDQTWLDAAGHPHSDQMHVVERYTRTSPKTIAYDATIEDPRMFTIPWKIHLTLRQQMGTELIEDDCDVDSKGVRHHVPPFKK